LLDRTRLFNRSRLRHWRRTRLLESLRHWHRAWLLKTLRLGRRARLLKTLRLVELTRLLNRLWLSFERPALLRRRRNWSSLRRGAHFLRLPPTLLGVLHPVLVVPHLSRRRTIVTGRL
jgi:hypothetical protein